MRRFLFAILFTLFFSITTYGSGGGSLGGGAGGPDATSIARDGSRPPTADISWGTNKLIDLVDPTSPQHGATKAYVDSVVGGAETDPLSIHLNGDNSPSANISWGNFRLTDLANPIFAQDAMTQFRADANQALQLNLNGTNSPVADIPWGSNKITGLADATSPQDALNLNTGDSNYLQVGGGNSPTANISWGNFRITDVANPVLAQDAATKLSQDTADALNLRRDGTNFMTGALSGTGDLILSINMGGDPVLKMEDETGASTPSTTAIGCAGGDGTCTFGSPNSSTTGQNRPEIYYAKSGVVAGSTGVHAALFTLLGFQIWAGAVSVGEDVNNGVIIGSPDGSSTSNSVIGFAFADTLFASSFRTTDGDAGFDQRDICYGSNTSIGGFPTKRICFKHDNTLDMAAGGRITGMGNSVFAQDAMTQFTHDADLLGKASTTHAATHLDGGSDELDVELQGAISTLTPANYTPSTAEAGCSATDQLCAHLKGIDTSLGGTASHASTHESLASDEVDGDVLDIDLTLVNIVADTSPAEVTTVAELSAILKGIDNALAGMGEVVADTATTTDNTVTTITTVVLSNDELIDVSAKCTAIETDGSSGGSLLSVGTFRKDGAADLVQVGTTTTLVMNQDCGAGANACEITMGITTPASALVLISGEATSTIDWECVSTIERNTI